MGLESVELVMALEEEFSIKIPDSEAAQLETPGHMLRYVVNALRSRGDQIDEHEAWIQIKEMIVEQLGVKPEQVTPEAYFVADLGVD
jgi:acyl carrier protein